jgi:large subunit ribosomal protein L5
MTSTPTQIKKSDRSKETRGFLEKIVVNAGIGRLSQQPNFEEKGLAQVSRDMALLTGQKPQICKAKQSIAGFKMRQGQTVGLKVTLRRERMVDFFERLITIVLPRVRDFNGLDYTTIDDGGVLNVGIKEQGVFPEVSLEQSPLSFSLGINIVPRIKNRKLAIETYHRLGAPLKPEKKESKKHSPQ